jgi:hypothetical protein
MEPDHGWIASPDDGDNSTWRLANGLAALQYSLSSQAANSDAERAALVRLAKPNCSPN